MSQGRGAEWILEGRTRLLVPVSESPPKSRSGHARGPATAAGGAFYNPAMRFARDLSILFAEEMMHRKAGTARPGSPYRYLDALAATGARAVRVANEARVPDPLRFQGVACDRDPRVIPLLAKNVRANGVADRVAAVRDDLHRMVASGFWDHVDVDPFGSPAPFLDSVVRPLSRGGTLALTATDTAALTGSAPAACRRRYDAEPWHGAGMHEAALRILAGAAVRSAARHEVALRPVLAHATDHFVRVYLVAETGAGRADAARGGLGFAVEEADGTVRLVDIRTQVPSDVRHVAGPMWTRSLQEPDLVAAMARRLSEHPDLDERAVGHFLRLAREEADAPALYYEVGDLARAARSGPPPLESLMEALRARGYYATRAHASPTGIKTDAPRPEAVAMVHALAR